LGTKLSAVTPSAIQKTTNQLLSFTCTSCREGSLVFISQQGCGISINNGASSSDAAPLIGLDATIDALD
jgi:hypothetical protein